jgi:hypothetical protein
MAKVTKYETMGASTLQQVLEVASAHFTADGSALHGLSRPRCHIRQI